MLKIAHAKNQNIWRIFTVWLLCIYCSNFERHFLKIVKYRIFGFLNFKQLPFFYFLRYGLQILSRCSLWSVEWSYMLNSILKIPDKCLNSCCGVTITLNIKIIYSRKIVKVVKNCHFRRFFEYLGYLKSDQKFFFRMLIVNCFAKLRKIEKNCFKKWEKWIIFLGVSDPTGKSTKSAKKHSWRPNFLGGNRMQTQGSPRNILNPILGQTPI